MTQEVSEQYRHGYDQGFREGFHAGAQDTREPLINKVWAYEDVLKRIACLDDELANRYLEATGSFGAFDEPGSVEMARRALGLWPKGEKT